MDYRGNTDKGREEKPDKQLEKVITGEVIQRPKGVGRKFKDIFLGGDLKATSRFVLADVIFPAIRNLIVDVSFEGVKRLVYGDSVYSRNRPTEYRPRVSYNNPIMRDPRDPRNRAFLPDQPHPYRQAKRETNDIFFSSKEDAERIVEKLIDIIDKYEVVSLADLTELLGNPPGPHTDNKWGWTYLTNIEIRQTRDGYLIDLPQMEAI